MSDITLSEVISELERKRDSLDEAIEALRKLINPENSQKPVPKRTYKKKKEAKEGRLKIPHEEVRMGGDLVDSSEEFSSNIELTPMCAGALEIGKSLSEPFSATDLQARLDGEPQRAYQWVSAWKRKGWISTVGYGQYKRSALWGED